MRSSLLLLGAGLALAGCVSDDGGSQPEREDAGVTVDGAVLDSAVLDSAVFDSAVPDGGAADTGPSDGSTDRGAADSGVADSGPADDATPDGTPPDGGQPRACPDPEALIADFYAGYRGPDAFSDDIRAPFEAFLRGEAAVCEGDLDAAAATLEGIWRQRPVGSPQWGMVFDAGNGANLGTPVAYYGLRMLQDIVDHAVDGPRPEAQPVRLTVALPGCSEGVQPRSWAELEAGQGEAVRHAIDPAVLADDHAVMRSSLDLFGRYVLAMTRGRLRLDVAFVELPDVCVPVYAEAEPYRVASIRSTEPVFAALDPAVVAATDWWMVVYPSHVPEQHPDFAGVEFISGGMGVHASGGPLFLADDRWFVRKPPHLGDGPYSEAERRTYLPQWLQHEFYHHLFRVFPEHGLEAQSHQWFDRNTWPDDFEGLFEADYYAESLHRRFWSSDPPLHARLRYAAPDPAIWADLAPDAITGRYAREPVQNPWHAGRITAEGDGWRWTNDADVSWMLGDAIAQGRLSGGPDNPYFGQGDVDFHLVPARDADGVYRAELVGFRFLGELYRRVE